MSKLLDLGWKLKSQSDCVVLVNCFVCVCVFFVLKTEQMPSVILVCMQLVKHKVWFGMKSQFSLH